MYLIDAGTFTRLGRLLLLAVVQHTVAVRVLEEVHMPLQILYSHGGVLKVLVQIVNLRLHLLPDFVSVLLSRFSHGSALS